MTNEGVAARTENRRRGGGGGGGREGGCDLVGFREKGEGFLGGEGFEQGRGRTDVYCTGGRRGVIVCLFSSLFITGAEQQL